MTILVPMREAAFSAYMASSISTYAHEKAVSGEWAEEGSLDLARDAFTKLLPSGLATPGNHLFELREDVDGPPLGVLWFAERERAGHRIAYVYEVVVKPEHQRKGHAKRAFLALEGKARELGLSGIALHVFGHNPGARALYEALGYRATNINMFKPIK
jgi:ribosomal protein S18 acetylase RimI-like enzyme